MNVQIDQLVRSLFQKDSLDQCSVQELEQYANRHPYFGAAQLLLTKKLQTENPDRYNEQLQKTFLFFHNPLWVEHLLNDTGNLQSITTKQEETATRTQIETVQEEIIVSPAEAPIQDEWIEPLKQDAMIVEIREETRQENSGEPLAQADIPPAPALKIEAVDKSKNDLLFQPYYTVDYFASQGIRYNDEEKPKDKLGQQLKSFTDWIKTMKRLPVTEIVKQATDPVAEHKVEQMAEHSLENKEVVTETMAEVWEKQGNPLKAIEIYRKLSLLDPSKSTYFAAKIEDLKKLN